MKLHQHSFKNVFWPLLIETFFAVLVGLTDTLMLYAVGTTSVAAVGSAFTYLSFINVIFVVIASGMLAVFTQYVGAGQAEVTKKARNLSLLINGGLALFVTLLIFLVGPFFLEFVLKDTLLLVEARQYFLIVGAGTIFAALNPLLGNYMRSFGHDKSPMFANIFANIVNITLNYLSIYVFDWGVMGVAWATTISFFVQFLVNVILGNIHLEKVTIPAKVSYHKLLNDALKVGLPSAIEAFMLLGTMSIIITMLNQFDTSGIHTAARVTVEHIARLAFVPGAALAHASSIKTGFYVGAGNYQKAQRRINLITFWGMVVSLCLSLLLAIFPEWIVYLFMEAEHVEGIHLIEELQLIRIILWINIIVELGRNANVIIGESLKVTGDALFLSITSFISESILAIGLSYYFGLVLEMGVVGVFIAIALDEAFRGSLFFYRWYHRRWRSKVFIQVPSVQA
jgi:putative MATE family efflux protein